MRTKHIDVKYHFIRERVEGETIEFQYCPTEFMEADLLSKTLNKARVEEHRRPWSVDACHWTKPIQPELGCWGQTNSRSDRSIEANQFRGQKLIKIVKAD